VREATSQLSRTHSCLYSNHQPSRLLRSAAGILLALAAILCIALPGFADQQVFEQSYPLASGGQFVLQNVNGSVRVVGWDRDEVDVRAVKTSESDSRDLALVKIQVDSHPGEVDVHTLYPDGEDAEVAVEYIVHVPYRVLLHSVRTVNGSVSVHGVRGAGELRSVNGNVEVLDSAGRFSAHTTNGNLHLELCSLTNDDAPMNLETVNGSVTLGLPSNASADLNVRNMNGDVSSDVPVTSTVDLPGARAFRGRLGHGGGPISLRTVNGGIRLLIEHSGV
jgi:Putative adhesin